jgi:hypothetical protein
MARVYLDYKVCRDAHAHKPQQIEIADKYNFNFAPQLFLGRVMIEATK